MLCLSQTEKKDTVATAHNMIENIRMETIGKPDSISSLVARRDYRQSYKPIVSSIFQYIPYQSPNLHFPSFQFTPGKARLFNWDSGAIVASGDTRVFPGIMQIDNGILGIYQSAGRFTFYAGGMVNKYGYFNGLHTQYGLNGNISFQFTPRLSSTVFGEYYFGQPPRMANGMPMPPSMIGYYGRSTFGGYLDYQVNDHWGIQTGVQAVQPIGTNRYQAEPIVTPYYKINKNVSIGLPVGQILYHIIRDNASHHRH